MLFDFFVKYGIISYVQIIQGMWGASFDAVNKYLDDGWTVKDVQTHPIGEGLNIQGVVLIEKQIFKKT
jgi:hypothetical protein